LTTIASSVVAQASCMQFGQKEAHATSIDKICNLPFLVQIFLISYKYFLYEHGRKDGEIYTHSMKHT
jgi:hypothetical protein